MATEKRKAKRRPLRYTAWVYVAGTGPQGCIVHDVSETGARLAVAEPAGLPEQFVLLLSRNGKAKRLCRAVWRTEDEVGVRFEKPDAAQS
jgi:PilZ domain-containing protein